MTDDPTPHRRLSRRNFVRGGLSLLALPGLPRLALSEDRADLPGARDPKVVLVQYGGCVRRRETIQEAGTTLSHFFFHNLLPQGTLYTRAENRLITGHAHGSLYLFSGRYHEYPEGLFTEKHFIPVAPTLGELARKQLGLAEHEVVVVHNEQLDTEFLWASRDPDHGPRYRPGLLSIYRLRRRILEVDVQKTRAQVEAGRVHPDELAKVEQSLAEHLAKSYRTPDEAYLDDGPEIRAWCDRFLAHYEPPGQRTREDLAPKGYWESLYSLYDRLLPQGDPGWTLMALRALRELRPRILSVIYRDVDYVHWGLPYLYRKGIQNMDKGLWELAEYLDHDPYYRDNTYLVVVPEAGRDTSPAKRLPFQHHSPDDPGAHEVFVYVRGPGVAAGRRIDRPVDLVDVLPTIGKLLGFTAPRSEGKLLEDLLG